MVASGDGDLDHTGIYRTIRTNLDAER
jgi:hypothetical protein